MELIPRLLLVGLALACLANAINNGIVDRPTIAPPPPWRGSGVLSSSNAYETPYSSADSYSSLEPYSFSDTAYPVPSVSSSTPHPQYSAIVSVRTTTWVLSRSTTITSIILETYYSTLTDVEAGTVTVTTTSTECTTASGYASVYASGCSSSSVSSSPSSSSSLSMVTMTWSPEVTAYPLPSTDQGRSPASTSATSSGSTTTTTTTASSGNETPPVVTGGARSAPQAAELRTLGVVAALLAMLL